MPTNTRLTADQLETMTGQQLMEFERRLLDSAPVPPECPEWCALAPGHGYEWPDAMEGTYMRDHQSAGGKRRTGAYVESTETVSDDGAVSLGAPEVRIWAPDSMLTSWAPRQLAEELMAAADLLERITDLGRDTDTELPEDTP